MKRKTKLAPLERNPFVQHVMFRAGAGAHGKSKKAQRRDLKADLRKGKINRDDFDKANFFQVVSGPETTVGW